MKLTKSLAAVLLATLASEARAQNIRDDGDFFRPSTRQWTFDVSVSSLFDSNIDRDELERSAQGVESGFVAWYRDRGRTHRFWIRYKGGAQFYNHSDRWDGGRSDLEAVLEGNVGSRFIVGGIGGHSLKVSSDDRELTHTLKAMPLVEYEIARATRVLSFAGFELRRPAEAEDVERIRTVGAEVATEVGDVSLFRFGYRYETSDSERSSRRYDRNTLVAGYDADFGRTVLRFELEYRMRRFPDQLVEIDEIEVPRADVGIIPSASWDHEFAGRHRLRLKYEYEARASNDPSKAFRGHRVEFSFQVPLKGRVAVRPEPRGGDGLGLPLPLIEADDIRILSEHEDYRHIEGRSFSRGSDWREVLQAQGVPTNISERPLFYQELWSYGASWVVLKRGRVISWHDAGNLNLAPERSQSLPAMDGEGNGRPEPVLRRTSRLETITEAVARTESGAEQRAPVAPTIEERPRVVETPSMAVARIAPNEIVLADGTRIAGRLLRYEKGLAYIIIRVGPKEKSLLATLPEELIDKEATKVGSSK